MRESGFPNDPGCVWPVPIGSAIELSEHGLVYAGGAVLVRMRKTAEGRQELAIGADRSRMLAMLSIAFGRPVAARDVLPHVETAADHWQRGEKALANLRLVFAGLAAARDPAASHRAVLAAHLLDQGWPPAALLEELGFEGRSASLEKYNPNHVPAGHGEQSGRFDFRSGSSPSADRRIVVAEEETDKQHQIPELLGETNIKQDEQENRLLPRDTAIPFFGGAMFASKTQETLSAAARAAATKVGPGKGPVYGTAVHTEFKEQVKGLNRPDLHYEQSYLNGVCVKYGTPGSIRVDAAGPTAKAPTVVYDLKTGGATLNNVRREQFRTHLPKLDDGSEVEIREIRP